jgi:N-methylhydantoinase B
VVVESRELRRDSCGAGKFRGGLGIDMRVRNLVEGKWNFEMPRRGKCPPWGLWDGMPGEPGGYLMRLPGERGFKMRAGSHIPVPIDAEAIVRTGGGGGWGDPLDRDPALVREDVLEGLISAAAARKFYGVALRSNLSLDESGTRRLRDRLRSSRKAGRRTNKSDKARTATKKSKGRKP